MIARRQLGVDGIAVPRLGFGVSGPHGLGLADTASLVHAAIDTGACLIDTAPFYGDAETRIGAALRSVRRDRFLVMSKVGTRRVGTRLIKDFSPAYVVESVEASIRHLRVETLDGVLLHGPSALALTDDLRTTLDQLKGRGLVRSIGACVRGPSTLPCLAWAPVQFVQAPTWELIDRRGWAARALEFGKGCLGIEALRPTLNPYRTPRSLADAWYLARAVAQRHASPNGIAPMDALRAGLSQPGMTGVVITTTRHRNLEQCVDVASRVSD